MLAAGLLEQWRLQLFVQGKVMPEGHHHQGVVDLSVFWQTGQYLLIGLSEVPPPLFAGLVGYGQTLGLSSICVRPSSEALYWAA